MNVLLTYSTITYKVLTLYARHCYQCFASISLSATCNRYEIDSGIVPVLLRRKQAQRNQGGCLRRVPSDAGSQDSNRSPSALRIYWAALVNEIRQVSGVQFCNTSRACGIVRSPPLSRLRPLPKSRTQGLSSNSLSALALGWCLEMY